MIRKINIWTYNMKNLFVVYSEFLFGPMPSLPSLPCPPAAQLTAVQQTRQWDETCTMFDLSFKRDVQFWDCTVFLIIKVECWLTLNSFWASVRAGHWVGMCDSQVTHTHTQRGQRRPEKGSSTSKSAIWQHYASPIKDCIMQRFAVWKWCLFRWQSSRPLSMPDTCRFILRAAAHEERTTLCAENRHTLLRELTAFMYLWFSVYDGGPFPSWYKTNLWVQFVNVYEKK